MWASSGEKIIFFPCCYLDVLFSTWRTGPSLALGSRLGSRLLRWALEGNRIPLLYVVAGNNRGGMVT